MSKTILIVDDSSMMRKMLKSSLADKGFTIAGEAKNGLEAIDMYTKLKPDVVTMDITMRDMDGLEAAKKIIESDDKASIIFLSNLDKEKYLSETQRIGAKGFVKKHEIDAIVMLLDSIDV